MALTRYVMIFLLSFTFLFLLIACSVRNNPVDPNASNPAFSSDCTQDSSESFGVKSGNIDI